MKKIIIAAISVSIAMAGGFTSKHSSETISAKEALKLNDDAKVSMNLLIKMEMSSLLRLTTKNGVT